MVLLLFILEMDFASFWQTRWRHVLWILPVVWGVLGIFWFGRMLDIARRIFEDYFGVDSD